MSFKFGTIDIPESEVFYESKHSIGLVNLKPIVPGHILIVPKRVVSRYSQLTIEEITDLGESAKLTSSVLQDEYGSDMIWLIQDGKEAGQTISHVHLHMIPKRFSEWFAHEIEDDGRVPRTMIEMKKEAERLKIKFQSVIL
ncbi:fragile histidine triad protein [Parasitella parasitica]|nr:fragile histidine triad protein [Parasitella parasitica]